MGAWHLEKAAGEEAVILNPSIMLAGDTLHIQATVDLEGLVVFRDVLRTYEEILKIAARPPADLTNSPETKP